LTKKIFKDGKEEAYLEILKIYIELAVKQKDVVKIQKILKDATKLINKINLINKIFNKEAYSKLMIDGYICLVCKEGGKNASKVIDEIDKLINLTPGKEVTCQNTICKIVSLLRSTQLEEKVIKIILKNCLKLVQKYCKESYQKKDTKIVEKISEIEKLNEKKLNASDILEEIIRKNNDLTSERKEQIKNLLKQKKDAISSVV